MNRRIYIDSVEALSKYAAMYLDVERFGTFGIDIETSNGRGAGSLIPWDGHISTIQITPGGSGVTLIIDAQEMGTDALGAVKTLIEDDRALKIAQNAKFEVKWFIYHLKAEPTGFFDTKLASQIIAAGDPAARHSLIDLAQIYAGITLDKTEQMSDWSVRPLSASQLDYAAIDSEVVLEIFPPLLERLKADDLLRVATIEFDAIKPIAKAEINGMHLDEEMWTKVLTEKEAELERLATELDEMLYAGVDWTAPNPNKVGMRPKKPEKPVNPLRQKINRGRVFSDAERAAIEAEFAAAMRQYEFEMNRWQPEFEYWHNLPDEVPAKLNPRSIQQMQKVLKNITGIWFDSTKTEFLEAKADRHPAIGKLVEHRKMAKLVSSYGRNILAARDGAGRVHTDFTQILDTGRMSSSDVNLQQVPHAEEYRAPFTAVAGRKIVIADYSQIELRVLAELGRDANFTDDFNSGVDMHKKGYSRFFGIPIEQVTPEQRYEAKAVNFGVVYGIGDNKLGRNINKPHYVAKKVKEGYFRAYPGNDRYLTLSNRQAREHLFARTMSGRIQRFRHDGSSGQIAAIGRNGQNMPIQGTSADMIKRALYLLDKEMVKAGFKTVFYATDDRGATPDNLALLINVVHDEIVGEAADAIAERFGAMTKETMERAGREYISVVPVLVEVAVADSWADKK